MSLPLLLVLLVAVAGYWFVTQIRPERQRDSVLRPGLAVGLLDSINAERHGRGLTALEVDEGLTGVAENKATHQFMTGEDSEGWEYPADYRHMLGRSLLLEALIAAPAIKMGRRLSRQRELFEGDWTCCGIGVAGGRSEQIVVAIVLRREAWETASQPALRRSFVERLVLGGS